MERDISLDKIWLCARMEYRQWLHNPRMILVAVLFVYMYSTVMVPMFQYAEDIPAAVGWFEPFVAVCNNSLLTLLFPLLFLVLMADFPRIEADTMFRVFRSGRRSWLFGQVVMLVMAAFTVIGVSFFLCAALALMLGAHPDLAWSEAIRTMASNHVIQIENLTSLLPSNLYYQVTLIEAVLLCWGLLMANCVALGMVMLAVSLWNAKRAGMVLCSGAVAIGSVLLQVDSTGQWIFPTAHFALRQHFTAYFSAPNMPPAVSFAYFGGLMLVALLAAGWKVESFHFIIGLEAGL